MKKIKRIFLGIIVSILIIVILHKLYHLLVIFRSHKAIEKFKSEENRYYSIIVSVSGNTRREEKVIFNQRKLKHVFRKEDIIRYSELTDFNTEQQYLYNMDDKILYSDELLLDDKNTMPNLPNLLTSIYKNNKINISKLFEIRYIIPTKYNEISCYKIITKTETIMIDRNTYLPVYSSTKMVNSDGEKNEAIENSYEFKVNEVTDEDVALPDFTDYTIVDGKVK